MTSLVVEDPWAPTDQEVLVRELRRLEARLGATSSLPRHLRLEVHDVATALDVGVRRRLTRRPRPVSAAIDVPADASLATLLRLAARYDDAERRAAAGTSPVRSASTALAIWERLVRVAVGVESALLRARRRWRT